MTATGWRRWRRTRRDAAFIRAAKLIDPQWYLDTYPDVAASGQDPVSHYVRCGADEGRKPHPGFDGRWYLDRYPDVARLGVNPLVHFERHGRTEGRLPVPSETADAALSSSGSYAVWRSRFDYDPVRDRERLEHRLADLRHQPRISVLMPVYNPGPGHLESAIRSVELQIFQDWELCIADDASTDPRIRAVLDAAQARDRRIKVMYRAVNGHISEASNSALALVSGGYVALLDHDDLLRENALAEVALEIGDHPDAELIYSDEDKIDADGRRYDPYFKPDFSRELFRSQNYLNHLTVHRTENIRAVGGWRQGFEGSQDYDLNLRVFERIDAGAIRHIPKVLYHWRAVQGSTALSGRQKSYAFMAGFRALEEHVARIGLAATIEAAPGTQFYRLRLKVPNPSPLVSLVIPTRDRVTLLHDCINSITEKTAYPNYEIIVVDNGSRERASHAYFRKLADRPNVRVLRYDGAFNYSAINNFAVARARGEIIGLINNDIKVISPGWLTEMVSWATLPDVGCVGAKLYFANETIQHAGVIVGIGGVAGHSHKHFPRSAAGYFGRLKITQNLSAVTGACLVVRKNIYTEVGGLNETDLSVAFNDVDFCLKVREAGYWNVWTPFAELYHLESVSRGTDSDPASNARFASEIAFMEAIWSTRTWVDPFYSANLTREREDFSIAT